MHNSSECEKTQQAEETGTENPMKEIHDGSVTSSLPHVHSAPGRPKRSPAQAPLRTVRESFPSHGSSLSKGQSYHGYPGRSNIHLSNLCHTDRRPKCAALLTPALRRTNRLASIIICISQ
jgi:hypothetical protein